VLRDKAPETEFASPANWGASPGSLSSFSGVLGVKHDTPGLGTPIAH